MGFRSLEWLLQDRIEAGLATIRSNDTVLDKIFQDLSDTSLEQLKIWLKSTEISIVTAFPRNVASFPLWAIHMVGETPYGTPIGNDFDSLVNGADIEETKGDFVRKAYQIFTLTQNPDTTIVLSSLLQHILKSLRQDLAAQGFMDLQMGQMDALDIKGDLLPVNVFTRVTNLTCLVEDTYMRLDIQAGSVAYGDLEDMDATGTINVKWPV